MNYARARAALASASAWTRKRSRSASESSLVAVVGLDSSGVVGRDGVPRLFAREPGLDLEREPGRRGVFRAEPGLERLRRWRDPGRLPSVECVPVE